MKYCNVCYVDEGDDGEVIMTSSSKVSAIRVAKNQVWDIGTEFEDPGIYFLLIGTDDIYVGESGTSSVRSRIMNKHTGDIDSSWHTTLAFPIQDKNITDNELHYLENAMCEYVYKHYGKCKTTVPKKENCNKSYRNKNYKLNTTHRNICESYIQDIEYYIGRFRSGIFPQDIKAEGTPVDETIDDSKPKAKQTELFYYSSKKRDCAAVAEIAIHTGNADTRETIVKKGSRISTEVTGKNADSLRAEREKRISEGKVLDRILTEDITFPSQSGACVFVNGANISGNKNWKTKDGVPLSELMV